MPYETVQHPNVATYDFEPTTEVSVHWTKDSHVQLRVEQHTDLSGARPGGPFSNDPTVPKPETVDPVPVGSVKVKPVEVRRLTSEIAIKIAVAIDTGLTGEPAKWLVLRRGPDTTESTNDLESLFTTEIVSEADVTGWTTVAFGDGMVTAATIFTRPLNRAEINRLIRVLRKARDDAYGADA